VKDQNPARTPPAGDAFMLAVVIPVLIGLAVQGYRTPHEYLHPRPGGLLELLFWTAVLATVELLPVPVTKVVHLTLGFPIVLGVAILYNPFLAATVALIGSFDSREIRREIAPLKSLFNRSQIALSVLAASALFHHFASIKSPLFVLGPVIFLATVAHYLVNSLLVMLAMRLIYGLPFRKLLVQLRVGTPTEFLLNYFGLGLIGAVIAELHNAVGAWSVIVFVLPLVFARQMFFRTMALEQAGKELKDRERVLRALSNRMAEERQDERMQIAAYLHDDLAQMLFRLTLQVEMAKKRLASGELESVLKDLDGITTTKDQTSEAIRALIRDLHRSPIGRKGLAEAMQSFAADISKGSRTHVTSDVVEVSLPPPIQLLIYQIAREAAMNALKHADAETISISLHERDEGVELQIRDDGRGFDTEAPPPEGHFGSVMMRERAQVAGGTFSVESEIGHGTTITAGFPRVWVEEAELLESVAAPTDGDGSGPSAGQPEDRGEKRPRRLFGKFGRESQVAAATAVGIPGRKRSGRDEPPATGPEDAQRDRRPVPA
jgi:signal transduction histidine kinase